MSIPDLPPAPLKWENQPSTATPFDAEVLNPWGDAVMAGAAASQGYAQIAQQAAQDAQAPTDQAIATALTTPGSAAHDAIATLAVIHAPSPTGGDDTTLLNDFLDLHAGRTVRLQPGTTYTLTDSLHIPSGTTLDATGTTLDFTALPTGETLGEQVAIRSAGTMGNPVAIGQPLDKWDRTVTGIATTSHLAAGDLILLANDETALPGLTHPTRWKGELNTVASVDSTNQITLAGGALHDYSTDGLRLHRIDPVENVTITGGAILMGGIGSVHSAVVVRYGRNITVRNLTVRGAEDTAVSLRTVLNGRVAGCTISDSTSPGGSIGNTGYGVAVMEGSRNCQATGNYFERCRHFVAGGGNWPAAFIDIADNHGQYSTGRAYDCHESTMHWRFARNTAAHVEGGFAIRGQHITVEDNTIVDSTWRAIWVAAWDGVNEQSGITVTGNRVQNSRFGIEADGQRNTGDQCLLRGVTVSGNHITDVQEGPAILVRHFDGATVQGNQFRGGVIGIQCDGLPTGEMSQHLSMANNSGEAAAGDTLLVRRVRHASLSGEDISGSVQAGIRTQDCEDVTLTGCAGRDGRWHGLIIADCQRVNVTGGTFTAYETDTDAIRVTNSSRVGIVGTESYAARRAAYITGTNHVRFIGNDTRGAPYMIDAAAVNKVDANNLT